MPDIVTLLSFTAACIALIIVPGPTVTVIVANSLRAGVRAGLMNVAGTQAGLAVMIGVLALGLEAIVSAMSGVFFYVKLLGAAYLIWLGVQLWRSNGALAEADRTPSHQRSMAGYFWQGFMVIWSNPKALFFFGAFIPQFIVPQGNASLQTIVLGGIFMAAATFFDVAYAVAAGRAGQWLNKSRVRFVERFSGSCLIAGGLWMASSRRIGA